MNINDTVYVVRNYRVEVAVVYTKLQAKDELDKYGFDETSWINRNFLEADRVFSNRKEAQNFADSEVNRELAVHAEQLVSL